MRPRSETPERLRLCGRTRWTTTEANSFNWSEASYPNRPIPQFNNSVFGELSCARLSFVSGLAIELVEIDNGAFLCENECQKHFIDS